MSKFFKSVSKITTYIYGVPMFAAKSTYDALTSSKNIKEAWQNNSKHLDELAEEIGDSAQKSVDNAEKKVEEFFEEHEELRENINHVMKHSAPHIGKWLANVTSKFFFGK